MIYTRRAKTVLLRFIQDAFAQTDLVDGQNRFLWNEDETQSKIIIADTYTEELENMEGRPAIILTRGSMNFMNIGMNQMVNRDPRNGTMTFQDNLKTSVNINCFSKNGAEAEELACIVFFGVQAFAEELKRRGIFEINSLSIGEEALIEFDSASNLVAVPVQIGMYIFDKWVVQNTENDNAKVRHDSTGINIHTDNFNIDRIVDT
jgi:hypothetical protein